MRLCLGGRCAEITVFDELSTGAGDDLLRATALARRMVTQYGMSEVLGPLSLAPLGADWRCFPSRCRRSGI